MSDSIIWSEIQFIYVCMFIFWQQALEERSSLQSLNAQLQHKLAEYFKKKKVNFDWNFQAFSSLFKLL